MTNHFLNIVALSFFLLLAKDVEESINRLVKMFSDHQHRPWPLPTLLKLPHFTNSYLTDIVRIFKSKFLFSFSVSKKNFVYKNHTKQKK